MCRLRMQPQKKIHGKIKKVIVCNALFARDSVEAHPDWKKVEEMFIKLVTRRSRWRKPFSVSRNFASETNTHTSDLKTVQDALKDSDGSVRPTPPTSVPIAKIFSKRFPLSAFQSYKDYLVRNNLLQFQDDLLSTLPFYPSSDSTGRTGKVIQTQLKSGNLINEFVIYPPGVLQANETRDDLNHLFMVHGYGGGLGYYIKNFDEISKSKQWCIHAFDLLGYGCSSRPKFDPVTEDLNGVELWFHDSIEEWLQIRKLDKIPPKKVLVLAHSMGAYLMTSYLQKKSEFCHKIIMSSPGAVIKNRRKVFIPKYFEKLWEQNYSPFSLVRKAGPFGSKVVSAWSWRRFAMLPDRERDLLHMYTYSIFQSRGSGEYMLNYLLAPGADARFPLIDRNIHKLNCRFLWCYGSEDWMDFRGGELCTDLINKYHGSENSNVVIIPNSGHHIHIDNPSDFNKVLVDEMEQFS